MQHIKIIKNCLVGAAVLLIMLCVLCFASCSHGVMKQPARENQILIVPRSGWQAQEPKPYRQHVPVRITIHHEGTFFDSGRNAAQFIRNIQVWGMGKDRNWADIPYHYLIAPDGTVYEGRNTLTVGETATEYNPAGHLLICCLGNFEVQELNEKQRRALMIITAMMCRKYQISPDSIATHKDFSRQTNCPGKNLYAWVHQGDFRRQVVDWLHKHK